jgi:phosphatidylglycerol lysyltransferase
LRWLEPLVGLGLFGLALAALHHELHGHGLREIGRTLRTLPAGSLAAAIGLVVISYAVLTLYDYLGVRYAEGRLPYRNVAPASFVSCALSQNLGMAALTGAPMRFRFYSAAGLGPGEIARIVIFVSATFWLGVVTLGGAAFVIEPLALPAVLKGTLSNTRPLGVALLLLTLAYLAMVAFVRRPIRVRAFELRLPSPRLALLQIVVASADLACAGGVLFMLLPPEAAISFPKFLAVYVLALIAGLVSQVPGGLGVFEAVVVTMLPVEQPGSAVLAPLLAYRAVYYILPLLVAGGVLAALEVRRHHERLAPMWRGARAWSSALVPHTAAVLVFLAGAVLLFSGSIPGLPQRLQHLGRLVPLPLIELSHLLGSLVGVCLLFVARGLQRRLDSAYVITVGLLAAGAVASLVKGLDYEEATLLGIVVLVLIPTRNVFYRKGALLAERFTGRWFAAIAVVLGVAIWLGQLAFHHVEYSREMWWQFALHGDAPRFLRAVVVVAVAAVILALTQLVGPAGREPKPAGGVAIDKAAAVVALSPHTASNLALLGDKTFLFSADMSGFIMYAVEGRSWISMGDPVGPAETQRELVWSYRSLVDRYDGWPVFYEVRPESAPLYLDLGLTLLKLGEEAVVPLKTFSLEGGARKGLRRAQRSAEKEGCSFEVALAEDVHLLLPELRRVSDQWLASKNTREKGFSLGLFDEAYVRRFPQALVKRNGAIVAFANIWSGSGREELSIDLMRYSADAPPGTMDYLFTESLLWGKVQGYRRFSLGMAPMSGMEEHALAPLWSRAGAFLFRHAENFYNFQGLRAYKNKFDPLWEPRYLASPAGFALPRILANLATLVGGGVRGVFAR